LHCPCSSCRCPSQEELKSECLTVMFSNLYLCQQSESVELGYGKSDGLRHLINFRFKHWCWYFSLALQLSAGTPRRSEYGD
jgi:hypothetical protein